MKNFIYKYSLSIFAVFTTVILITAHFINPQLHVVYHTVTGILFVLIAYFGDVVTNYQLKQNMKNEKYKIMWNEMKNSYKKIHSSINSEHFIYEMDKLEKQHNI